MRGNFRKETRMRSLGLYLHIPFCVAKCRYCDFCSSPAGEDVRRAYVAALCREIAANAKSAEDYVVDTVFFGGGTPSLLPFDCFGEIADALRKHYAFAADAEWTAEANPATVDEEKLYAMRASGINRLSLGMQSAQDIELAALGRAHRARDLYAAVAAARSAGFDNLSLDLMFGIPHQTKESFADTLDTAIGLAPTHLSVYSLQIEEGTPFHAERDTLPLPSEDEEAGMSALLLKKTAAAGYLRYEISNYAKVGYECRHNLRYWQMKDYLGFGIAAHSLMGDRRFYNREDLSAYLQNPLSLREEEEILSPAAREYETVMLGLRMAQGLDDDSFREAFGYGFFEKYEKRLSPFLAAGLVLREGKKTALNARGMAVSNTILAKILED